MSKAEADVAIATTRSVVRDYYELTKPRVVMLIVFTAVVGMLLAVPGMPPLGAMVWGTLGIGLASSSAAAINQIIDARVDAQMARTRHRPLVLGNVSERQALVFAALLCVASMAMLWWLVNPLTAAVFDHFRLDAAALLGAGDRATRRIRQSGYADAAGHTRRRLYETVRTAVHDPSVHRHAAAVAVRHDGADLSRQCAGAWRPFPRACHSAAC